MKICKDCQSNKDNSEFSKAGGGYLNTYCKECASKRSKKWKEELSGDRLIEYQEKQKLRTKKKYAEHKEELTCNARAWRKTEEGREYYRKRYHQKKTDVQYIVKQSLRHRIYMSIKGFSKSASTTKLLGCSIEEFIRCIEFRFEPGMSWMNYGQYIVGKPMTWHIDHIKPCASFDLTDPEQQRICFHWTNMQPMWAVDNILKGDTYKQEIL